MAVESRQFFDNSTDGANAAIQDLIVLSGADASFDVNIPASLGDNAGVLIQWGTTLDDVTLSSASLAGIAGIKIAGSELNNAAGLSCGGVFFPIGDAPTSGDRTCTLTFSGNITAPSAGTPTSIAAAGVVFTDVDQTGRGRGVTGAETASFGSEGSGVFLDFVSVQPDQYVSLLVIENNNTAQAHGTTAGSGFVDRTLDVGRPQFFGFFDQIKGPVGSQSVEVFGGGASSQAVSNTVALEAAPVPGASPRLSQVTIGVDSDEATTPKTVLLSHDHNGDGPVRLVASFVDTGGNNNPVTASATYNGVAMTEVARSVSGNFRDDLPNFIFFELDGAASGVNDFEFDLEIGTAGPVDAIMLVGVSAVGDDGTGDFATAFSSANLTTLNPALTTEENNSLAVAFYGVQGANKSGSFTTDTDYDLLYDQITGPSSALDFTGFAQIADVPTAGARSAVGTWSPGDDCGSLAFEIKLAAVQVTVDLSGSSPGVSGSSASLRVDKEVSGSSPGVSGSSASLRVVRAVSGTATAVSGSSAAVQVTVDLSGSASGVSSSSANISVGANLSASAAGVSDSSAALRVVKAVSGAAAGASGSSAFLAISEDLSGTSEAVSGSSSALSVGVNLSASAASASGSNAFLAIGNELSGTSAAVSGSSSNLVVGNEVSGQGAAASGSQASLQVRKNLSGAANAVSFSSARLAVGENLSGVASAVSGSSANLLRIVSLSGSVVSVSGSAAEIVQSVLLVGASEAQSSSNASISVVQNLAGTIVAVSSATGNFVGQPQEVFNFSARILNDNIRASIKGNGVRASIKTGS